MRLKETNPLKDHAHYRPYREVISKVIGHVLRLLVPLSFFPYDDRLHIKDGYFVTNTVNPVACFLVDTNSIGGLAKTFMRKYKPGDDIFRQRPGVGQITYIHPSNPDPQLYIFFVKPVL